MAKNAKKLGKPVIVRMFHEMNGNWFEWSLDNFDNDPERFKKAWRHIVREFRKVGADNVRFLWTPYIWGKGRYDVAYPGNRYVDYVGVTSLNWGDTRWKPLVGLLERPMGALRKVTGSAKEPRGKPVILPEVGSNYLGGDKAAWIRDGYHGATKRWPAIKALIYFDYDTTPAGQPDWRLAQPPDGSALAAYQSVAAHKVFRASLP
jgi:beta-mannanase